MVELVDNSKVMDLLLNRFFEISPSVSYMTDDKVIKNIFVTYGFYLR